MIVRELQNFLKYLQRHLMKTDSFVKHLKSFVKAVEDPNALICKSKSLLSLMCIPGLFLRFVANAPKYYSQLLSPFSKLWGPFLDAVMKVGALII